MIRTDGRPTIASKPTELDIETEIVRMEREADDRHAQAMEWDFEVLAGDLISDDSALD